MKKPAAIFFALVLAVIMCGCCAKHNFSPATCTTAATCTKCGETNGSALGHNFSEATCTEAGICRRCGATQGSALGHKWVDADCETPTTCSRCGETDGKALGHSWTDATCTEAKTCSVCGKTGGDPLGHTVDEWVTLKAPTCTESGEETGTCTVCGAEVSREISKAAHAPGDWIIAEMPTKYADGTRVKLCAACGAIVQTESFTLSDEELKELYKENCRSISYKDLSRTPDAYMDEYVKFSGTVVQVCYEATSSLYYSAYRVATSGSYGDVVYIYVDNYGSGSRILEDDKITFYGTYGGLYTYTTVLGDSLTIPSVYVEYLE